MINNVQSQACGAKLLRLHRRQFHEPEGQPVPSPVWIDDESAGAYSLNLDGSTVAVGDYSAQARKAMENLVIALKAAGARLHDILSTRVLVASSNQSDLVDAWKVIREAFGRHDVSSTLVGVTVLGYTGQLVEIEAVAAVID